MIFQDRRDAGRQLAAQLERYRLDLPAVLAMPRGGVIIADEVCRSLDVPMAVVIARRLSDPKNGQIGIGAIAEGGVRVVDELAMRLLGIAPSDLAEVEAVEAHELSRRVMLYRKGCPLPRLVGRTVILVDDGLASGLTAKAAIQFIRSQEPARVVLAVPVAGPNAAAMMLGWADDIVITAVPPGFWNVSQWYHDFDPAISDSAVLESLLAANRRDPYSNPNQPTETSVTKLADAPRMIEWPTTPARGLILFAHGAGSDRLSPRNRAAADAFLAAGFATMQFDLLSPEQRVSEQNTHHLRFNVGLLKRRIEDELDWLAVQPHVKGLALGGFGASIGAAAMLAVAADRPRTFSALVSRGGRPDYVEPILARVTTPTLLLVGGNDSPALTASQRALQHLGSTDKSMTVIENADHLFDDPQGLAYAINLARDFFMSRVQ